MLLNIVMAHTKTYGWAKIQSLKKVESDKPKPLEYDDSREKRILEALMPFSRLKPQNNLTEVQIDNVTRKTSIAFLILPEWATKFPPYNVARLAAVTKQAGYKTYAYDLNAKAYKQHKHWPGLDFDPWSGTRDWKWRAPYYLTDLHPYMEKFFNNYIDKLIELDVTAVGFTLYYCNAEPTKWMAQELKRRKPDIKIIVGGPDTQNGFWQPEPYYDYIVTGEGEKLLLQVLSHIEEGLPLEKQMHLRQLEGERLNLDTVPVPDYSYFNHSDYDIPNGVNFELSRGCTAKCVFCNETHFWKYRGRMSSTVLTEILELYNTRGVDVIWFLDSLVNGNLKELRAFAKGIIASGAKISWTGYARCDERMDLEYLQDLADSGCIALSFGIESGSENVLKDMDKGVTVKEIEQNLRDCTTVGIEAFSTWVTGFPTETTQDFYETLTLIWRNRNTCLTHIPSGGGGYNVTVESIVGQNFKRFHIANATFEDNWIKDDFTNSKYHRMIRIKMFSILNEHLVNDKGIKFGDRPGIVKHFNLKLKDNKVNEIEFEKFDFNLIKSGISDFADSLMNEIFVILRLLYRTRGSYSIEINFNPNLDLSEFSERLGGDFHAVVKFDIDSDGNFTTHYDYKFKQKENAWSYFDYSGAKSVGIDRARKLSGLAENLEETKDQRYEYVMNTYPKIDLSFEHSGSMQGKWD